MEYNTTGYILPVGKRSSVALNYFRSDAFVISTGETDRGTVESDRGLDCGTITDPEEQQQCKQGVDNIIAKTDTEQPPLSAGRAACAPIPTAVISAPTRFFMEPNSDGISRKSPRRSIS